MTNDDVIMLFFAVRKRLIEPENLTEEAIRKTDLL